MNNTLVVNSVLIPSIDDFKCYTKQNILNRNLQTPIRNYQKF